MCDVWIICCAIKARKVDFSKQTSPPVTLPPHTDLLGRRAAALIQVFNDCAQNSPKAEALKSSCQWRTTPWRVWGEERVPGGGSSSRQPHTHTPSAAWRMFLWHSNPFAGGNCQSFGHGRARQSDSLLPALGTGCLQPSGCCFTKHGCLFGGLCSSFASRCQSARSAVFTFLTMFWGKKEKKGIFVRREEREVEQLFKTQVPLSKTLFPTVPQNKPNQMNFCPASFWLNHAMKIYALPILS